MTPQLQLLQGTGNAPGELGFKLTGRAKDGRSSVRIWLRRAHPWSRALNPRIVSDAWDCRVSVKVDSSFTLLSDFGLSDLDALAEAYEFPQAGAALDALPLNGDAVHDRVLLWARRATGGVAQGELAEFQPRRLSPRYTKETAAQQLGARMPLGRPVRPYHEVEAFVPAMNRPVSVRESAGIRESSSPAGAAGESSPTTGRPARPTPLPPPRVAMTSRLQAIREEVKREDN